LNDAFILKLNSSGEFVWAHQISGPATEFGFSIAVEPNGNSYTSGSYSSLTDFNYGNNPVLLTTDSLTTGNVDGYILALDAEGNFRWVKRISGPDLAEVYGIAVSPGSQGGVYAVGIFDGEIYVDDSGIPPLSGINNSLDIFYCSMDHNGNFKFLSAIGGPAFEFSQAIAVNGSTSPPTIYSTGFFSGTPDFDPGPNEFPVSSAGSSDIYVLKLEDLVTDVKSLPGDPVMDITIYPNPANQEMIVKIPWGQSFRIKVLNDLGMPIHFFETAVTNDLVQLDVSSIPSGIFFIQVNMDNQIIIKKISIIH